MEDGGTYDLEEVRYYIVFKKITNVHVFLTARIQPKCSTFRYVNFITLVSGYANTKPPTWLVLYLVTF